MLTIENLNYTYSKSGKHAIKGIDFSIEKGQVFGLLGPSGAGKTTTQRLVIGLLAGYTGSINILGKERSQWGKDIFEEIGVAFDFPNLYTKLTGLENLNLIGSYYQNKPACYDGLFKLVGLYHDRNTRVENYSKGMKMRLNFIRSILHQPVLMFFDEPTSGLDPVNAKVIKDMILEMKNQGKTIFLTTHNMTVAEQLCDQVAFINEGKISAMDSPENLMYKYGQAFVSVQARNANGQRDHHQFDLSGLGDNPVFRNLLKDDKIMTIHSNEATLEDIFIKLTGRSLS